VDSYSSKKKSEQKQCIVLASSVGVERVDAMCWLRACLW